MLIESPFRDYYDHAAAHGVDTTIRYKRVTSWGQSGDANFVGLPPLPHKHPLARRGHSLGYTRRSLSRAEQSRGVSFTDEAESTSCFVAERRTQTVLVESVYVGFCGKLYPCVQYGRNKYGYAYSKADLLAALYNNHEEAADPSWELYSDHFSRGVLETDVPFGLAGVPVLLLSSTHEIGSISVRLNPCLREYGFQMVVPDFEAWQKIEAYLTNVLRVSSRETVEISDIDKVHKAGFDVKASFRKGKNG